MFVELVEGWTSADVRGNRRGICHGLRRTSVVFVALLIFAMAMAADGRGLPWNLLRLEVR